MLDLVPHSPCVEIHQVFGQEHDIRFHKIRWNTDELTVEHIRLECRRDGRVMHGAGIVGIF